MNGIFFAKGFVVGATGVIEAYVIGVFTHTYVTTFDGRKFECFGRDSGGSFVQVGIGDSDLAECIARHAIGGPSGFPGKVIGMSGIVYLFTGVCHQAANRILWAAGIKLPLSYPLIKRSVQQFGSYGKEIDQMPGNPDDGDLELRSDLQELLKAGLPGRRVNPHRFEKLVRVHKRLRELQYEFAEQFKSSKIGEQQYLQLCKRAAHTADKQGEEILGYEDYHRAFGSPETIEELYIPQSSEMNYPIKF